LLGYHVIAERLHKLQASHPPSRPNPYRTWIDNYLAEDYIEAVKKGRGESSIVQESARVY